MTLRKGMQSSFQTIQYTITGPTGEDMRDYEGNLSLKIIYETPSGDVEITNWTYSDFTETTFKATYVPTGGEFDRIGPIRTTGELTLGSSHLLIIPLPEEIQGGRADEHIPV